MTVAIPDAVIKHDGEFVQLNKDINSLLHRFYRMTLQKSVVDQILAGVRVIASMAVMCQQKIEEIVEAVRTCLSTNRELDLEKV